MADKAFWRSPYPEGAGPFPRRQKGCRFRAEIEFRPPYATFMSEVTPQQLARLVSACLILLGGLYVLSAFFAPLGWAVVLAIATWPLYQRFRLALPPRGAAISPRCCSPPPSP